MKLVGIVSTVIMMQLFGCTRYSEAVTGTYAAIEYVNSKDTIHIFGGGIFQRKVYDKFGRKLLENYGTWELVNGSSISMHNFFLNCDYDLVRYPDLVNDTSMKVTVPLGSHWSRMRFCVGAFENECCYRRISGIVR